MNIVNKLTLRHLKLNRRRTMVTVIGVIIAVTMITAVATFAESFMGTMRQNQINTGGNWHVSYEGIDVGKLDLIQSDPETKSAALTREDGYAKLPHSENSNKPYLFIKEYNKQGLTNFPVTLTEGRLPQNSSEILIPEHLKKNGGVSYGVGETLTLEVGDRTAVVSDVETGDMKNGLLGQRDIYQDDEVFTPRETRTYTVVGRMEQPRFEISWAPGYTVVAGMDESALAPGDAVTVSVELKNVSRELFGHAKQLAEKLGMQQKISSSGEVYGYEGLEFNNSLLQYSGVTSNDGFQRVFYLMCLIVIVIIMIGSISLIFNAFSISISERSRHLGMLASVGATKAQKRQSVFFEGGLIGLVSIPLGILFGIGGMWVTFQCINPLAKSALNNLSFELHVSWLSVAVAVVFAALTIFISTWLPARRASKITPIDAIRQTKDVKLKGRTVKTSRLTRKVFGFEAELALKNLKRNKRRYKATIFSLAISILLFLSVSSFMQMFIQVNKMTTGEIDYNISVDSYAGYEEVKDVIDRVQALPDAGESVACELFNGMTNLPAEKASDLVREEQKTSGADGYPYSVGVIELDDREFDAFCRQVGADAAAMRASEEPRGILLNKVSYQATNTAKFIEGKATRLQPGDSVSVCDPEDETGKKLFDVRIDAVTEQTPKLLSNLNGYSSVMTVVLPRGTLAAYRDQIGGNRRTVVEVVFDSPDPNALEKDLNTLIEQSEKRFYVMNLEAQIQKFDQMTMIMLVFAYGFIILISAICVANIFNTISTSIQLRKREFAMLKSVGMTPKGFNRMLNYESIFYGVKALLYGIPLSFVAMLLMHKALAGGFSFQFAVPWIPLLIAVVAVFVIVGSTMLYAGHKVKRENIIDALKEENA